jgi:hypothetical protein
MKKLVLTLIAGFCIGGMAFAQEPSKVARKKAATPPVRISSAPEEVAKRDQAKIARAKAAQSEKAAAPKSGLKAETAN